MGCGGSRGTARNATFGTLSPFRLAHMYLATHPALAGIGRTAPALATRPGHCVRGEFRIATPHCRDTDNRPRPGIRCSQTWICLVDRPEHRSDIGWHERNLTVKRTGATVCAGKIICRLSRLPGSGTAERCSPVFSFVYFTL